MERVCENCKKNELRRGKDDGVFYYFCSLGFDAFYECQCACTDDYFEPKE